MTRIPHAATESGLAAWLNPAKKVSRPRYCARPPRFSFCSRLAALLLSAFAARREALQHQAIERLRLAEAVDVHFAAVQDHLNSRENLAATASALFMPPRASRTAPVRRIRQPGHCAGAGDFDHRLAAGDSTRTHRRCVADDGAVRRDAAAPARAGWRRGRSGQARPAALSDRRYRAGAEPARARHRRRRVPRSTRRDSPGARHAQSRAHVAAATRAGAGG